MVLAIIVLRFSFRKQKPNTLPFRFQTKVQGGGRCFLKDQWLWCPGSHPSGQVGHWAVQQQARQPGSWRPTLRASRSSLLLPLFVSPVCQGWRGAGAASLLVCVVGVACVSFLVFGLIAALLP